MAVITSLLLTRHGEAHCNVAGVAGGEKTCTGLTERGRMQVRLLAERLHAEAPPDVLYAAPRPAGPGISADPCPACSDSRCTSSRD